MLERVQDTLIHFRQYERLSVLDLSHNFFL